MTAWRLSIVAAGMLFLSGGCVDAMAGEPPPPDYPAIRAAARQAEPGKDYLDVLPARLEACRKLADSYNITGITSFMIESKYIVRECLTAMIVKIAELHPEKNDYAPCGIEAILDKFAKPYYMIYDKEMDRESECGDEYCGTMAELHPHDKYIGFLRGTVEMMVLRIEGDERTPKWRHWRDAWREAYD
ncbi:MAG: hypothetical protein ACREEE_11200 [Dongiaceae bacterium]